MSDRITAVIQWCLLALYIALCVSIGWLNSIGEIDRWIGRMP